LDAGTSVGGSLHLKRLMAMAIPGAGVRSVHQGDQSTTRANRGLGIGLFAARKIAELLGGRVELRRHPGGGMEAILHLPDTNEDRSLVAADIEAADAAAVGS